MEQKTPLNLPKWQQDIATQISGMWDRGLQFNSQMNDMYDDLYAMLRGERPDKNYDWESNIVLNKTFQVVWKAVSYSIKKIFGASPVIGVDGFNEKGCWQREVLLDAVMNRDAAFQKTVMGLLRLYLNGVTYIKKTYKQEFEGDIPIVDRPHDVILNNRNVVVDWALAPSQGCREGRFVIHQEKVDINSLYTSKIDYFNLDKLRDLGTERMDEKRPADRDGKENPPESDIYKETSIMEFQGVFPVKETDNGLRPVDKIDKDTKFEMMIIVVADRTVPIRLERHPYGEINIIDAHLYFDPERWESMGMIEPVKDTYTAINDNINMIFDEKNRSLMPPTVFNKYAQIEWDTIQHAPNQKWLVGGNPDEAVFFPRIPPVSQDGWTIHQLLDAEHQSTTSITPTVEGMGREKTATQGVLNAQFSTDKLDFFVMMIEHTWLRPSAQMNIKFMQMFMHPITFLKILGEPFKFDQLGEDYKFKPVASSVKLEQQKEKEIQEDLQLLQIVQGIPNPNTPKIMNRLLANILRNRDKPEYVKEMQLDEDYFEPGSESGEMQVLNRMRGGASNQNGIPMSTPEKSVRAGVQTQRGMMN